MEDCVKSLVRPVRPVVIQLDNNYHTLCSQQFAHKIRKLIMLIACCRHVAEAPMYLLVNKGLLLCVICFAGQRGTARHLMLMVVASMTGISILQKMVQL